MLPRAHQRGVREQNPFLMPAAMDIASIAKKRQDIILEVQLRGEPMIHATAGGLILFFNMPAGSEQETVAHVAERLRAF